MSEDQLHWRIDGGKAAKGLAKLKQKQRVQREATDAFLAKHGAENVLLATGGFGRHVSGVICDKPATRGWKQKKGEDPRWWFPDRRSAAGKSNEREMREIECASTNDVGIALLGCEWAERGNGRGGSFIHRARLEIFGDVHVVSAIKDDCWKPIDGLTELKASEYWALKEAEEEQKQAA